MELIGCKTGLNYFLSIEDAIKDSQKLDKIFNHNVPFLILLEPNSKRLQKIGKFNVTSKETLFELISQIEETEWKNYTISFIEEIQDSRNSMTGTAISNGKGELYIEILKGTTNSKYLTSTGADPTKLERCYFSDYETISQIPKEIPLKIIEKVKEYCHYFNGYYEFIYGSSKGKEDIYFTFYSDIKDYGNILNNSDRFAVDEITARVKYNYLKQNLRE